MIPWDEFAATAERAIGKRWKTRAARLLRRSPATLRRWEERGMVPDDADGEARQLLGMETPRSQSDLIAEALTKAFNIKMIG